MIDDEYQPPDLDGIVEAALDAVFGAMRTQVDLTPHVKARIYRGRHVAAITVGLHSTNQELVIRCEPNHEAAAIELLRRAAQAVLRNQYLLEAPACLVFSAPHVDVHGVLLLTDRDVPAVTTSFAELSLLAVVGVGGEDLAKLHTTDPAFEAQNNARLAREKAANLLPKTQPWLSEPTKASKFFTPTVEKSKKPRVVPMPSLPGHAPEIDRAWARFEAFLAVAEPRIAKKLSAAAAASEIASLEQELGAELPPDFKRSLQRHDGLPTFTFPGMYTLISTKEIRAQLIEVRQAGWSEERATAHGPVREVGWDDMWLPITDGEGRYYLCLDLNPPPAGTVGQVIHIGRFDERSVVAASWTEYLINVTAELMGPAYVFEQ
jgi:cell wall assembly regulator SMI1